MRFKNSRAAALVAVASSLVVLACQHAEPPVIGDPSAPEHVLGTQGSALTEGGVTEVVFARRMAGTTLAPNGVPFDDRLDGKVLAAGETFPLVALRFPAGALKAGQGYGPDDLPAGVELDVVATDITFDRGGAAPHESTDPLCADVATRDAEGRVLCGRAWQTERYRSDDASASIHVDVESLDLRVGGRVDLTVRVPTYRVHLGADNPVYCCGDSELRVEGWLDAERRFTAASLSGVGIRGSQACQYATLADAVAADPCPSTF